MIEWQIAALGSAPCQIGKILTLTFVATRRALAPGQVITARTHTHQARLDHCAHGFRKALYRNLSSKRGELFNVIPLFRGMAAKVWLTGVSADVCHLLMLTGAQPIAD